MTTGTHCKFCAKTWKGLHPYRCPNCAKWINPFMKEQPYGYTGEPAIEIKKETI